MTDHDHTTSNPDAVVDSIDRALRDFDMSPDAMRWVPPAEEISNDQVDVDEATTQMPAGTPPAAAVAAWVERYMGPLRLEDFQRRFLERIYGDGELTHAHLRRAISTPRRRSSPGQLEFGRHTQPSPLDALAAPSVEALAAARPVDVSAEATYTFPALTPPRDRPAIEILPGDRIAVGFDGTTGDDAPTFTVARVEPGPNGSQIITVQL